MKPTSSSDLFLIASTDSMKWLENARLLKISADLMFENIAITYREYKSLKNTKIELHENIINWKNSIQIQLEDKLKSYSNTYYLIAGYAFENLIKGISIEKNRNLTYDEIFKIHWRKHNSGHGISNIACENINSLSEPEIDLIKKLEMYIVWGGKYIVAKKLETFLAEENKKSFNSSERTLIDNLFIKLTNDLNILNEENNGW